MDDPKTLQEAFPCSHCHNGWDVFFWSEEFQDFAQHTKSVLSSVGIVPLEVPAAKRTGDW